MKIAFLEDDEAFAPIIIGWLQEAGHEVAWFKDSRMGMKAFSEGAFDLYLLDYNMPQISGLDVMVSLRAKGVVPPVIFLTGRDSEEDVIEVLDAGADDYIVKPVSRGILFSRINALLRRSGSASGDSKLSNYGDLVVDFNARKFTLDGQAVTLTEKETELALYFFAKIGALLSRAHLIQVVWSLHPEIDTRTIDVHISHLRKKLALTAEYGWKLSAVYQQGYRLERLE
jgi:two-component system, OmpR family, response regulator RegX3